MLDTSGSRIRVECGPVAVRALHARLLFFIKFHKVYAVSEIQVAALLLTPIRKGAFRRSAAFPKASF
jgi:hypothetical protein